MLKDIKRCDEHLQSHIVNADWFMKNDKWDTAISEQLPPMRRLPEIHARTNFKRKQRPNSNVRRRQKKQKLLQNCFKPVL